MNPPDLLVICLSAFVAVFFLLSFLAVVMRLLISAFPAAAEKIGGIDSATIAAITAAAAYAFPGTKVTKVEEIQ
jgi:hypothetical protein